MNAKTKTADVANSHVCEPSFYYMSIGNAAEARLRVKKALFAGGNVDHVAPWRARLGYTLRRADHQRLVRLRNVLRYWLDPCDMQSARLCQSGQ
jgi:hypothetical protein